MDPAKRFLDLLFAGKEDAEYVLIWLLDGRRSAWFQDLDKAVTYVHAHAARDVYFGVALSPADHGPSHRLKVEGGERPPSSIVGLWADLDIANQAHKKENLPGSADEARSILFPDCPPSIVVHSGGGLQAWWLFKEPWVLDTPAEIERAGQLATRWVRALRARANVRGWDIDAVGDLPRVLRVPGTTNGKIPGVPRPVTIESESDDRYNPSSLEDYLDAIGAARVERRPAVVINGEALVYNSDAAPDPTRFQLICEIEPKFAAAWEHNRKDLKDQSASAYDMALANVVVQAGWSDQDIVNLLIAHRRKHGQDLKLRDSYYLKTLSKAREKFEADKSLERLETLIAPKPKPKRPEDVEVAPGQKPPREPDPDQAYGELVAEITRRLRLPDEHKVVRIEALQTEPRQYVLRLDSGTVRLGPLTNLVEQKPLRYKIAECAQHLIPAIEKDEWSKIAPALVKACKLVEVSEDATDKGSAIQWLTYYLSTAATLSQFDEHDTKRLPFWRNGKLCIYGLEFRKWLRANIGDNLNPQELAVRMRAAGCQPKKVSTRNTSRQVWELPTSFAAPEKAAKVNVVADDEDGEGLSIQ